MQHVKRKNISLNLSDIKPPLKFVPAKSADGLQVRSVKKILIIEKQTEPSGFLSEGKVKLHIPVADVRREVFGDGRSRKKSLDAFIARGWFGKERGYGIGFSRAVFWRKKAAIYAALIILAVSIFFGANIFTLKNSAVSSGRAIYKNLTESVVSLKSFKPERARGSLQSADRELASIKKNAEQYGVLGISGFLGNISPVFGYVPAAFNDLQEFIKSFSQVATDMAELKTSGFSYFFEGNGGRLLALLHSIQVGTGSLSKNGSELLGAASGIKNSKFGGYLEGVDLDSTLPLIAELYGAEDFLGGILQLLERPNGFHLALFFQNPSEMRPSGGFIGSYADLYVKDGALQGMDVRDIYDPDGQFEYKIVPPKPLQGITTKWGARDANWFFDFPTSAQKVLAFLQNSKIYSEQSILFEGAIALNTDVIESLLGITGPVNLPGYNLEINEDNFLSEVQKEVETGQNKTLNQPKKILKDFTPLLLAKLKNLNNADKEKFFTAIQAHIQKKDVQIFLRNDTLEAFIKKYGLGGEVYQAQDNPVKDYLAVVNANVAGGKSDVYINQQIILKSHIDSGGIINNELTVKRTHNGKNAAFSWYRATNQNYMQIFTPKNSKLMLLSGNKDKTIYPRINYKSAGYITDVDVLQNQSGEQYGKQIFDAWVETAAGEMSVLNFTYQESNRIDLKSGSVYSFVFDRQSGVRGGALFEFEAPAGFKWQESGSNLFIYTTKDLNSRITIDLTFEEI